MATTITVSGNSTSGPYSVSAIDWHPYGLLQQQSTVFRLDAADSATLLTYGDDYIFDQEAKSITLVGDTLSSQESLRVTRETPDTFFASLPDLGVADALSAKSNDLQVMNRLSEVEADLAQVSGEVSLTYEGEAFTSVSAGTNISLAVNSGDLLITSTATGGGGGGGGFTDAQFGNGKPAQASGTSPILTLDFSTTGFYGATELSQWFIDENIVDTSALNAAIAAARSGDIANDIAAAISPFAVKTISNSDGSIGVTNTSGDVELSYTGPDPVSAPTGSMTMWCGLSSNVPDGWALCDGTAYNSVSDTTFADLYATIGTTFGGTDASNFLLPDMRGNVPVGVNGLNPDLGETGGESSHMLDGDEIPRHKHSDLNDDLQVSIPTERASGGNADINTTRLQRSGDYDSASHSNKTYSVTKTGGASLSNYTGSTLYPVTGTSSFGTQQSVSLMQPYVGVHYIIKK